MSNRLALMIVVAFVLSMTAGRLVSQSTTPVSPIGSSGVVSWEFDGTNTDGSACNDLESFVVAAFQMDGTTQVNSVVVPACGPQGAMNCEQAIDALQLSDGAYIIKVKSVDTTGNASAWSPPLPIALDGKSPSPPAMPKVKVTVTVEVGG